MAKLELGTLVEVKRTTDSEKMVVVKIDQARQMVLLENQQTGDKVEMTFAYFESMTGIPMDKRQVLHG
jgi:hypothetical protein